MTVRELYRNILVELNKEEASSLYVEDFLYFANKAINWYVNMRYNLYEVSQQLTDDLRILKTGPETLKTAEEILAKAKIECMSKCYADKVDCIADCQDHECSEVCKAELAQCMSLCDDIVVNTDNIPNLDKDYRHLLNCVVEIDLHEFINGCDQNINTVKRYAARRLTSDKKAAILNNSYLEPRAFRPYFDIRGNNIFVDIGERDGDKATIKAVSIEYLRDPEELTMSHEDLLTEQDTTMKLEFSKYVNIELTNAITTLILEQGADPRLGTNPQVNQSIGPFGGEK